MCNAGARFPPASASPPPSAPPFYTATSTPDTPQELSSFLYSTYLSISLFISLPPSFPSPLSISFILLQEWKHTEVLGECAERRPGDLEVECAKVEAVIQNSGWVLSVSYLSMVITLSLISYITIKWFINSLHTCACFFTPCYLTRQC